MKNRAKTALSLAGLIGAGAMQGCETTGPTGQMYWNGQAMRLLGAATGGPTGAAATTLGNMQVDYSATMTPDELRGMNGNTAIVYKDKTPKWTDKQREEAAAYWARRLGFTEEDQLRKDKEKEKAAEYWAKRLGFTENKKEREDIL